MRSFDPDSLDPDDLAPANRYLSRDAADYDPDDIEQHFVELSETGTASEASALAAKLRRAGIIALANAEHCPLVRGARGILRQDLRTFVMVFASELDQAIEVLNAELEDEGEVPVADIEQQMQDADENPDSAMAWFYQDKELQRRRERKWVLWGLVGLAVATVLCWLL